MHAWSWSAVILFTVSDVESLRICLAPDKSFQNGMGTSFPPPDASSLNLGFNSTMPHLPKLLSSAVRSIAYFSNSVGIITSAICVLLILHLLSLFLTYLFLFMDRGRLVPESLFFFHPLNSND